MAVKSSKKSKVSKKVVSKGPRPIKEKLNATQILDETLAVVNKGKDEDQMWERKHMKEALEAYFDVMRRSIMPGSVGEFMVAGHMKIVTKKIPAKKVPAIKKGTMVMNPFKGKEVPHAGRAAFVKPATMRVKIRPLAKLKLAATGE